MSQIDLPLPCRRLQTSIFSPKFYSFKYLKLPTSLNELSTFSLKNKKKWSPYKVWLYGHYYQMYNLRIMSKAPTACNSICCSFILWLGAGSVNPWSTAEDLEFACKACTQQSIWTQLNRFAKSSSQNLTLHYLPGSCCWSLFPEGKRWLSAVTCPIIFQGEGQKKEVLLPYLVSQSLGMAPSVHVHCCTKYLFCFIFSPLYF